MADVDVDLLLEPGDLRTELAFEDRQRLAVEGHADGLDPGEDRDEWQLDLAEQPLELDLAEPPFERLTDRHRRQGIETGPGSSRQVRSRRKDLVEVLRDDVGDRLAAERGVEDVRGDLRVERDRQRLRGLVLGEGRDEDRLHLVADQRDAKPLDEMAQCVGCFGAIGGDHASLGPGDGQRERSSAPRPRVVREERDTDRRLGREPRLEVADRVHADDLDAPGVEDRLGEGGRQVLRRLERGRLPAAVGGAIGAGRRGSDGVEVEAELQLAARRADRCPGTSRAPALGTAAGDPRSGHVAALRHRSQPLRPLLRGLAGHRRQPLDQRPELVLAEQAHDGVAVVVAETRGLEIDLDRQVADDRRQLAAHEHLLAVLAQLVAQLLGGDIVEALEERVERAELADELRGGLLAHPRHAGNVVRRVALERLVIDHLVRPQPEPLVDPRHVVDDRVLDAGARRHQADARRDELEHVEVDGDDRRLQVVAVVELARDRPDDVVGLVAGHLVDRDPEGLHDLAHLRKLVAQVVRHLHAGCLVVRVLLVAEGRPREVEGDREVVGLQILDPAQDDAREPEDAIHQLTLGRGEGRESEVAAVDEPVAVEQHQAFGGHVPSVPAGRAVIRQVRPRLRGPDRRSSAAEAARGPAQGEQPEPDDEQRARDHHELRYAGGVVGDRRQ